METTVRDALVAEILGDVGKLHTEVTKLRAQIGPQLDELRQLVGDAREAAKVTASPPPIQRELALAMSAAADNLTKLARLQTRPGHRLVWPLAVTALAVVILAGWLAVLSRQLPDLQAAARDPALCLRLGGQPHVSTSSEVEGKYCVFGQPLLTGEQPR